MKNKYVAAYAALMLGMVLYTPAQADIHSVINKARAYAIQPEGPVTVQISANGGTATFLYSDAQPEKMVSFCWPSIKMRRIPKKDGSWDVFMKELQLCFFDNGADGTLDMVLEGYYRNGISVQRVFTEDEVAREAPIYENILAEFEDFLDDKLSKREPT